MFDRIKENKKVILERLTEIIIMVISVSIIILVADNSETFNRSEKEAEDDGLTLWYNDQRYDEYFTNLAADYEKVKGIKVNVKYMSDIDYLENINKANKQTDDTLRTITESVRRAAKGGTAMPVKNAHYYKSGDDQLDLAIENLLFVDEGDHKNSDRYKRMSKALTDLSKIMSKYFPAGKNGQGGAAPILTADNLAEIREAYAEASRKCADYMRWKVTSRFTGYGRGRYDCVKEIQKILNRDMEVINGTELNSGQTLPAILSSGRTTEIRLEDKMYNLSTVGRNINTRLPLEVTSSLGRQKGFFTEDFRIKTAQEYFDDLKKDHDFTALNADRMLGNVEGINGLDKEMFEERCIQLSKKATELRDSGLSYADLIRDKSKFTEAFEGIFTEAYGKKNGKLYSRIFCSFFSSGFALGSIRMSSASRLSLCRAAFSFARAFSAPAPLWQAYMSRLHANLPNRDILEGNASNYHVVRVETCTVSGQLATDACRADAMGYGTTTDYWAEGTAPTMYCQMHVTETVCAETGMAASPWCPNPVSRGVISIPAGHPLYSFLGTKYQEVLEEYLGTAAASSGLVCTWHNAENQQQAVSATTAALIADAKVLLANAEAMLQSMDPSSAAWQAINSAATTLENIIMQEAPSQSEVAAAMAALTQAMAGIY